jgi:signal transduction histidine kinase
MTGTALPTRRSATSSAGARRRLGRAASAVEERRAEILVLAYALGGLGMLCGWVADPASVTNAYAVGVPVGLALVSSSAAWAFRRHLPRHTEDVAIAASLVLIPVAAVNLANPALLTPYYVWVGFASPLWFPTRRAVGYLLLTALAAGTQAAALDTRLALATWFVTMATVLLAFLAVHFLSRTLVRTERLAAVGEMASAVGHELRNPLGAVTNALYLARAALGQHPAPEVERQLQLAEREAARAVAITDHLRAYVRPRRAVAVPVDVGELVAEVLQATAPPAGVVVERHLGPVSLVADRGQLAEVLTNLVENA